MVISAQEPDLGTVATLAAQLWPDSTPAELVSEFQQLLSQGQTQFFLKVLDDQVIGFAQCQLRQDYVEGTSTSPVGYLEGLFIYDQYRHQGYATELLNACKAWAKSQGCTEFASDCAITNEASIRFHLNAGFTEANRIVCFTSKI